MLGEDGSLGVSQTEGYFLLKKEMITQTVYLTDEESLLNLLFESSDSRGEVFKVKITSIRMIVCFMIPFCAQTMQLSKS